MYEIKKLDISNLGPIEMEKMVVTASVLEGMAFIEQAAIKLSLEQEVDVEVWVTGWDQEQLYEGKKRSFLVSYEKVRSSIMSLEEA